MLYRIIYNVCVGTSLAVGAALAAATQPTVSALIAAKAVLVINATYIGARIYRDLWQTPTSIPTHAAALPPSVLRDASRTAGETCLICFEGVDGSTGAWCPYCSSSSIWRMPAHESCWRQWGSKCTVCRWRVLF